MKPVQQSRIYFNTPISAPQATKSLLCSLRWSTARSNSGDVVLTRSSGNLTAAGREPGGSFRGVSVPRPPSRPCALVARCAA